MPRLHPGRIVHPLARAGLALMVLLALLVVAPLPAAHAATIFEVTSTADNGAGSLRQMVASASPGDTITFAPSLNNNFITLTSGPLVIDKDLTIRGSDSNRPLLAGNFFGVGVAPAPLIVVATFAVNISGLNIGFNHGGVYGGAIFNGGRLTLSNCVIGHNDAGLGGAIYNAGTLTLSNCVVADNRAEGVGGAIYNAVVGSFIKVTLNNSTISDNTAHDGGGLYFESGRGELNNSTINHNYAIHSGGGIYNSHSGSVFLNNSTVSDNEAGTTGGGIYTSADLSIEHSTVSLNRAEGAGGILSDMVSPLSTTTVGSSIIAGNSARSQNPDVQGGAFVSHGYNLIGDSSGSSGFTNGINSDQVGSATQRLDPQLGPLQNNGGLTETQLPQLGSPVRDIVPFARCSFSSDQRGVSRPQGARCDSGAVEVERTDAEPLADDDAYTLDSGPILTVIAPGLLANDHDPDGDPLETLLSSAPSHGTLALTSDGAFTYMPDLNFMGTDSFVYKATDGIRSATATVRIAVVNPVMLVANDDNYLTGVDMPLVVQARGVLTNDSPSTDPRLTAVLIEKPPQGTLTLSADGAFKYTPAPGFRGVDQFTYMAMVDGAKSNTATVSILVEP